MLGMEITLLISATQLLPNLIDVSTKMKAAPSLKARRTLAIALAPFIAETIRLMRQRDMADGLHTDHVALRADRIFTLLMIRFCDPCRWSKEQAWEHLDATGDENLHAS